MKLDSPFFTGLGGLLAAKSIRAWMATLDYRAMFYDPAVDPAHPDCRGQKIYVFWHEYILFPIHLRGHCNLAMLLSRHRDADILARAAYHLGFDCVRGSTFKGSSAAIREMLAKGRQMNLAITPDGPRGPRQTLAQGSIFLASKLQLPIVAMGFGFDRPWRANSWDRFAIPKPHSRACALVSPELHIPPGLDRAGVESYRLRVEHLLNRLTQEAETWAATGKRRRGEVRVRQQTAAPANRQPAPEAPPRRCAETPPVEIVPKHAA